MEWLEAFLQAAETKSLTKASERLHISQPALSKQIRNLETDLGAPLLLRSSRGVTLTPAGRMLLDSSKTITNEISALRREIASLQDEVKTDFAVGSWPSVATLFLPNRLAGNQQAQSVEINIRVYYSFHELLKNVEYGTLDAALFDDRGVKHSFYASPLFTEEFLLFVNVDHALFGGKKGVSFEEIKNEAFLMLPGGCDARELVEDEFSARGEKLKLVTEVELGQSIMELIQANEGISILPAMFVHQMKDPVKAIPILNFGLTRQISIIAREEAVSRQLAGFIINQ
ncbi:LysR family transcriptional regulator [Paenibacillus glycinis]|uniref:LysR family transcriptional regulator n=1 Tax=Paenibacillus glycinis TaxID=2697035 RepID=A0ABW9XK77_9BACL|nr:LysR family transcriptional regulator [Paenibacillus glycinis]NBD23003.1 LysR family transcriptional regulator [Paenibacillus glycinis]